MGIPGSALASHTPMHTQEDMTSYDHVDIIGLSDRRGDIGGELGVLGPPFGP